MEIQFHLSFKWYSDFQLIEGSLYIEGVAHDNMDGDITNQVLVSGEVDSSKSGNYASFTLFTDQAGDMSDLLKRTVIVSSQLLIM